DYLFSEFSARVQIKTHALPFFILYFILRKIPNPSKSEGKIGVGRSERCSLDQLSFSHCF
ncbi:hypothetical protein, partial [Streptococcus pneumoniae]|uniref:hypothetical protein n=1 Tax=Streptococcus pneumoniae TaxID=1313 RepID=UPI001C4DE4EA